MIVTNIIDKAIKYILVALMAVLSFLGVFQVVGRAIGVVPAWTEEAIRFLFVWASCVGAAIGIKEHIHIGIDVIVNLLPKLGQKICAILVQLILLGFDAFIIKVGFQMVAKTMTQASPALRLPMAYVYLAVPVMGILGIWYSVLEIIKLIREKEAKADA
jgi:TRAP-type C4-dicarboxylate transport system permease small subunit